MAVAEKQNEVKEYFHELLRDMWIANARANTEFIRSENIPSAKIDFKKYRGEKTIVCGIGDSMLEVILLLHKAQSDGWKIMAVDRARPQLLSCGLRPDFTVSVDAQKRCADFMRDGTKEETFYYYIQCDRESIQVGLDGEANVRVFADKRPSGALLEASEILDKDYFCACPDSIVGSSALDLALQMGFKKVITIGTELGWKTEEDVEDMYRSNAKKVDGEDWWTIKPFELAAAGFKTYARTINFTNLKYSSKEGFIPYKVIDASGGLDKGFRYMLIEEALIEMEN